MFASLIIAAGTVPVAWAIPFALLLGAIATLPLVRKHWWEHNYPWIAIGLGLISSSYYLLGPGSMGHWLEGMEEYFSFIVLLSSLFIISGGIEITVARKGTPFVNCVLLLIGAVIANLFGTTGAAMLLIRPYLRMNRTHLKPYHVVFFIFIVANAGGCLTPIGDPPLFIGYLMGVPFWWVFQHMWGIWTFTIATLLVVFVIIDVLDHRGEARQTPDPTGLHISGALNFVLILIVSGAVFRPGLFHTLHGPFSAGVLLNAITSREILMIAAGVASYLLTKKSVHVANEFTFAPIREVAILFAGIFATMLPAIELMQANAERMPVRNPTEIYFAGGVLSSLLDNAPTYKTFVDTKLAKYQLSANTEQTQMKMLLADPEGNPLLVAISAAAVLFGACTYIGNGPNLMVKSIAESAGAPTPGFFAYIAKYALTILVPIYIVVWLIFIRH